MLVRFTAESMSGESFGGIVYLILQAILLAMAVSIGFVLQWCIPSLNIGHAILVATLSSIACGYLLVESVRTRHIGLLKEYLDEQADEDEDDEWPDVRSVWSPVSKRHRRRSKKK